MDVPSLHEQIQNKLADDPDAMMDYILAITPALARYYEDGSTDDYIRVVTMNNYAPVPVARVAAKEGKCQDCSWLEGEDQMKCAQPGLWPGGASRAMLCVTGSEWHCLGCGRVKSRDVHEPENRGWGWSCPPGYDSSQHFKYWMERLQGKQRFPLTDDIREKIEYILKRDGIDTGRLTCHRMRAVLKEAKLTKLNEHIVLLVCRFGGVPPPELDRNEVLRMSMCFDRMMELYKKLPGPRRTNNPYYPYFIYKIGEALLPTEKLPFLDYIHMQSRQTVIKNDGLFEQICKASDGEFVFKPTPVP